MLARPNNEDDDEDDDDGDAAIKEGYLMKQTWSFQRWRRRYFRLKGQKLYYAKDSKVCIALGRTAL
ncbi:AGAP002226-PA-like protein [Anopheles sinensis]|uniref:AGAP002226-PA-like protein n=1 Tax=Anopheles sinensis TaxID=74873 RepID=A0A084W0Z8_ANOSI|nr:AGAP002226-PA-like protein [Anopheles sinensis]